MKITYPFIISLICLQTSIIQNNLVDLINWHYDHNSDFYGSYNEMIKALNNLRNNYDEYWEIKYRNIGISLLKENQ